MSLERFLIERALLFRVPGIRKINSVEEAPGVVTVFVGDADGNASEELLAAAKKVMEEYRPLTTQVEVQPYSAGPGDGLPPCDLSRELKKACVFVPPTKADLELLLKTCIPGCMQAEATTVAGGVIEVCVGDENGRASEEMLAKTGQLLKEIFPPGVTYQVGGFSARSCKGLPGIASPSRRLDPALSRDKKFYGVAKEDEERFLDNLPALVCGAVNYQEIAGFELPRGRQCILGSVSPKPI